VDVFPALVADGEAAIAAHPGEVRSTIIVPPRAGCCLDAAPARAMRDDAAERDRLATKAVIVA
jgi:hypothetical protein